MLATDRKWPYWYDIRDKQALWDFQTRLNTRRLYAEYTCPSVNGRRAAIRFEPWGLVGASYSWVLDFAIPAPMPKSVFVDEEQHCSRMARARWADREHFRRRLEAAISASTGKD